MAGHTGGRSKRVVSLMHLDCSWTWRLHVEPHDSYKSPVPISLFSPSPIFPPKMEPWRLEAGRLDTWVAVGGAWYPWCNMFFVQLARLLIHCAE